MTFGRCSVLVAYTAIIVALLLSVDAPVLTFHFTDDVGFRAAWTTISQVPLVYLLSMKRGPLSYLTGLSYNRVNYLHRLVGRTIFLSATVHMGIMMSSISITDIIQGKDSGMQVVRYGIATYSLLTWIALSSVLSVREKWYRLFFLNHWISTIAFLGMALNHVPRYARSPFYVSFAFVLLDKCLVTCSYLWNNISLTPVRSRNPSTYRRGEDLAAGTETHVLSMGHAVKMSWTPGLEIGEKEGRKESTTIIRLTNVPFKWRPGQHVRMLIPKLGMVEVHPFTPATSANVTESRQSGDQTEEHGLLSKEEGSEGNDMTLMIKAHRRLTKRLANYYDNWRSLPCPNSTIPSSSLAAFLDGPYGNPPEWEEYENMVMIGTSSGVSLVLAIQDYLEQLCAKNQTRLRTRRIRFVWAVRHIEPHFEVAVIDLLARNSIALRDSGVDVTAEFYVTCSESAEHSSSVASDSFDPFAHLRGMKRKLLSGRPPLRIRNPNQPEHEGLGAAPPAAQEDDSESDSDSCSSEQTYVEDESEEQRPCLSDADASRNNALEAVDRVRVEPPATSRKSLNIPERCNCALLRHNERSGKKIRPPQFLTKHYGQRPDVAETLASAISPQDAAKSMVVFCGGSSKFGAEIQRVVSGINMEFARGRRKSGVGFYSEGIS